MSSPSRPVIVNFNNYPTHFNVAIFNIAPLQVRENGRHATVGIFGIAASVLLTALQLKYQAGTDSPYQDHSKAMAIAIACFLVFCLGCDLEQYFSSTQRLSTSAKIFNNTLRLFGFISLASLAYAIFSTSTSKIPLLIVYLIFPWFFSARFVLHWIQHTALQGNRGTYNFNNLSRHFPFNHYTDHVDSLPVYHIASSNQL